MSVTVNTHQYTGQVLAKAGAFSVKENMSISFLYCRGTYMKGGKECQEDARFACFSFADNASKISQILPGDEVSFYFNLTGRFTPDRKGNRFGEPVCWTEQVISSKVEVLNTSQRQLYQNEPSQRPAPDPIEPKFSYGPGTTSSMKEPEDDPSNDLPFSWFIPFLLPLCANFLI